MKPQEGAPKVVWRRDETTIPLELQVLPPDTLGAFITRHFSCAGGLGGEVKRDSGEWSMFCTGCGVGVEQKNA